MMPGSTITRSPTIRLLVLKITFSPARIAGSVCDGVCLRSECSSRSFLNFYYDQEGYIIDGEDERDNLDETKDKSFNPRYGPGFLVGCLIGNDREGNCEREGQNFDPLD